MGKPKKYEERLMDVLGFNEDDLAANQAGALTQRQVARIQRQRQRLVLGGGLVALFGFFVVMLIMGAINLFMLTPATLAILAGTCALFIGLAGFFWWRSARTSADLRDQHVAEVEGRVDLSVRSGQNSASYYLRVGDRRFTVRQKAFLAFKNGDPYRIYYLPHSKRILSVEWLRDTDDNLLEAPTETDTIAEPEVTESDSINDEAKLRR